jgi:hypothetical protein
MRPFQLIVFTLSLIQGIKAQPPLAWINHISGSSMNKTMDIETDRVGNVFVLGAFSGTVDFDPGPSTLILNSSNLDPFIIKMDAAGGLVWVKQLTALQGLTSVANAVCLTIDTLGDIYIGGNFNGLIDFDPGPLTYTMFCSQASNNGFLVKLSASGNFLWAKQLEGAFDIFDLIINRKQNVSLTGKFSGAADFDPGPGLFTLTSGSNANAFLLKLDRTGNFHWAKALISSQVGSGQTLAIDKYDRIIFGGRVGQGTDMDPGAGVLTSSNSCGYICIIDSGGAFIHCKMFYGGCYVTSISSPKDVLVGGFCVSVTDLDPGPGQYFTSSQTNGFLARLDSSGSFLSAQEIIKSGQSALSSLKISTLKSNEYYLTGLFTGTYDLDPGPGIFTITAKSDQFAWKDIFCARYSSSGTLQWAFSYGPCVFYQLSSTTMDNSDILFAGVFVDTIDFDPGPNSYTLAPTPGAPIFINKLSSCSSNSQPAITITSAQSTVCIGSSLVLNASGGFYYHWSHELPPQPSVIITPTSSSIYSVTGIDVNGCTNVAYAIIMAYKCTNVEQITTEESGIFPNPTSGIINLKGCNSGTVYIFDNVGRLIYNKPIINAEESVDINALPKGIYTISVVTNQRVTLSKKLLKN